MASGNQMLTAVREAIKDLPCGAVFRLNKFDAYDLCKLEPKDLEAAGFAAETIDEVINDLRLPGPSLKKLGESLGARLVIDKDQKNLIPGEGIRRTAGIWANGEQSAEDILEATVEEVRMLRHPAG